MSPNIQSSTTSNTTTQPASGNPSSPAIQTDPVQEAADKIENLIDSDGVTEWAATGEVTEACNVLAGLDPQTADSVVDELANRGSLDKFAQEVVDKSWIGPGLTADNRATLFDNFAKQLDAESLLKVSDAFRNAGTPKDGEQYVQELTAAINNHASPEVRSELTTLLAERANTNTGTSSEAITQKRLDGEQASDLLTALEGEQLENTLQALDQNNLLDHVLESSVRTEWHMTFMGDVSHVTYDTSRFDTIMEHVADLSNPQIKSSVFAAGVTAMKAVDAEVGPATEFLRQGMMPRYNDEAANEMAASLTKVLDSDVEGVMNELTYHVNTADGSHFTAYAKQMLEAGATDQLGTIFAKLQLGNDLNGNPTERLETVVDNQSGNEIRPHAEALGYFVGSIYAASADITSDQRQQAEFATAVIKGALTVVDKSKIGGPAVGLIASVGKESVSIAMKEALVSQDLKVAQQWEIASVPVDPQTQKQAIGSDAFSALTDRIDHIFRINQ
jgi:hypothetical protein